jgi:RNA polymerase sigma-70 factor (family 1)
LQDYSAYSDDQLVALLKLSDHAAFTEIYNRYWKSILYKAGKKLGDIYAAEEIVQDIFTDIWHRRQLLEINSSLAAYLATATKYRIINARQKKSHETDFLKHQSTAEAGENLTEQTVYFDELKDKLSKLVHALPTQCKLVYQLHKEEGLSHKEVSKTLSISEKTVQYHLSRALTNLRMGLNQILSSFF